jgi:two-component system response regulator MtrA
VRVAIADPDPAAADLLMFVAQRRGHQAVCVSGPRRLLDRLPFTPAVLVVSFVDLDADSLALVASLRAEFAGQVIILLTERSTTLPPLAALKAGANDVVLAPWNPFEVILRGETWLANRVRDTGSTSGIRLADLEVDLDLFTATKNGRPLTLTRLERRLLFCLCQHHPNVATIDRLLAFGWDALDEPDAGLLKTHVSHVRRKLKEAGGVPFAIVSHQTVGYSLRASEAGELAS